MGVAEAVAKIKGMATLSLLLVCTLLTRRLHIQYTWLPLIFIYQLVENLLSKSIPTQFFLNSKS